MTGGTPGWSRSFRVGQSCPERVKMSPGARANPAPAATMTSETLLQEINAALNALAVELDESDLLGAREQHVVKVQRIGRNCSK